MSLPRPSFPTEPRPLVTHARFFMPMFSAYLTWVTVSIPVTDLGVAGVDFRIAAITMTGLGVVVGVAAAISPRRFALAWLAMSTGWLIARGTMLLFGQSTVFLTANAQIRAGVGWLLWVPVLAVLVAVVSTDSKVRYLRRQAESRNG